jgi:hypothetical protein
MIPLWFKVLYTALVLVIVAVWYRHYGLRNFLWFSDIALIGAVPALWLESPLLASVLAVVVLLPELMWNVDIVLRLSLRRQAIGLTDYMFEHERPRILRTLSLFHVPLPLVLLWMVSSYGYDRRALVGGAVLVALVLPASRVLGTRSENINWTHALRSSPAASRPPAYVVGLTIGMIVVMVVPTHLVLALVFVACAVLVRRAWQLKKQGKR